MLSKDGSPEAPVGAEDEIILLQAPACVQRFTAPRQIMARLRALARRRERPAVPDTGETPLKLQVEENPNWSATEGALLEGLGTGLREWRVAADDLGSGETGSEGDPADAAAAPGSVAEAAASRREAAEAERSAAIIRQLEEDNQDLKAALCRLIRVSEENHAAIRLLEEENEDLAAMVHRLTLEKEAALRGPAPVARGPLGVSRRGMEWLRRWGYRCT
jgi:hypothetical protein